MRKVIALIICTLFFAGQGTSEVVISNGTEVGGQVGDYIQYELIDFPTLLGESLDEEKYLRYSNYKTSGILMELTSKGQTMFEGESVDFTAGKMTWDEEFTLYYDDINDDGDGKEDIVTIHYFMQQEVKAMGDLFSASNLTVIEESTTFIMNLNMSLNYYEEQTNIWSTSIERLSTEILNSTGGMPDELKVGSTWTEVVTERDTGTSKERMCDKDSTDDCEWEYEEIDEEETTTTTYQALRELSMDTPAGTFDVLEVVEIEEGEDSGNYTMTYVNDQNLPISMIYYEDNSIFMQAQLKSYKISGLGTLNLEALDDDETSLPSLPILLSFAVIALVASSTRKD